MRVHWSLLFACEPGETIEAVTEDLSSRGFYCLTSTSFAPGETRFCTLSVPANDPDDPGLVIPVHCRVRVVRVEALAEKDTFGMGCSIEDYWVHAPDSIG
jgi:hypothetical protein